MILLATSDFSYTDAAGKEHKFFGPQQVDGVWQPAPDITDPDEIAVILANDDLACRIVIKHTTVVYDRNGNPIDLDALPGGEALDEAAAFEKHGDGQ